MRRFLAAAAILCTMSASAKPPEFPEGEAVRELRAGVICYGGVSLAIYMYGTVRELHHLALASSALECDAGKNPAFCGTVAPGSAFDALPSSAKPYYEALVDQWRNDPKHVRTRVVIDIVSGTSAGGINGIFLAKALAHNRSIDGLRKIWFEEADIRRLATGKPWYLSAFFRLLRKQSALGGDAWLRQLHQALETMDTGHAQPALPSLLWLEQPIELRVTATDFYGTERLIEVGDPPTVSELRYDHVFRFGATRGRDGAVHDSTFDDQSNAALAFAARASASFPVAFPAIPIDQLKEALRQPNLDTATLAKDFFGARMVDLQGASESDFAAHLYLVDGGVLDNYPFAIAYQRVSRRSPALETRRVFLYLEPDPRVPRSLEAFQKQKDPNAFQMLLRAKSAIPGAEPIAQDLQEIHQHNQRVERISEIIRRDEQSAQQEWQQRAKWARQGEVPRGSVALRVEGAMDASLAPEKSSLEGSREEIVAMRDAVEHAAANSGSPLMEEAYLRLRVHSVLDQFSRVMGRALCDLPEDYDGPRTALMRALVMKWAAGQRLTGSSIDVQRRADFLNAFDLGYLRRKLRFVNDWLNLQYDPKEGEVHYGLTREQLQSAQAVVAKHVANVSACVQGRCLPKLQVADAIAKVGPAVCVPVERNVAAQADAIFTNHGDAIDTLTSALEAAFLKFQEDVLVALHQDFLRETGPWPDNGSARAVLARYLGFPFWDRVAYPYTAFSGVGDLARIDIIRLSPNDTSALSTQEAAKLSGKGLGHFGAFFDPDGRERDYVWGRFDGAERLLHLIGFRDDRNRLLHLLNNIVDEERSAGAVKKPNLEFMQNCVAHPGTC